ncbi:MAG TPA: PEP-CTERM sorting domain-containing protein [Albitalea sp.]|nr:PEP-CTERM sorting domain-containing protein [Albitalea sp.]
MTFTRHLVAAAVTAALLPMAAQAETFATATHSLLRGSVAGDMASFYGGTLFGSYPVALTDAEARAAVLGAPDNTFLSLPGVTGTPSGSPFPGAYVEVSFGADFGPNTLLKIWELGDNQESAQIFLWTNNGGNIQFQFTRGASDINSFDLSGYAGTLAALGATSFTKVGIGGLDENGASKGFDLDAVSITAVPEPSTYALMLAGLGIVGWVGRRRTGVAH